MSVFFLKVVRMSISASWIVLVVMFLRLLLKKAPKWISVLLWGIVAVRLICPISIESRFSLMPPAETAYHDIVTDAIVPAQPKSVESIYIPPIFAEISVNNTAPIASEETPQPAQQPQTWDSILTGIWLSGIAILLVYTLVSYWRLKHRVRTAVLLRDRIYQCDRITTPFVLGLIRPKIYLPFHIQPEDTDHVIAHEQAHVKRLDHWWKPVGFLLLTLHWFNPLMWAGYILLCRDIELACDEKVIKNLDIPNRANYSQALLNCSVNRRMIAACPLAFGENSIKKRIKSVLHYKKPAFWVIVIAITASIVLAIWFLTNPVKKESADTAIETQAEVSTTPVGGADAPLNVTVTPDLEMLKEKFPMYFDLDSSKGLEVYIWQMSERSYYCGVLPGVNRNYTDEELWDLHKNAATIEEMRVIIDSYNLPKQNVHLIPIQMPFSSFAYTIDDTYKRNLEKLFWENIPFDSTLKMSEDGTVLYVESHPNETPSN